jgi:hypothetical protein
MPKTFRSFFCSINIEHFRMKKTPKNSNMYNCISCHFNCCKNNEWLRHISTAKHQNMSNLNILEQKNSTQENYVCNFCNKIYKARNSLWYHKKKCQITQQQTDINKEHSEEHSTPNPPFPPSNSEIIEILKVQMLENQELRKFMMEQHKQMMELASKSNITNMINSNCNNNSNNTFNLQFFLNEKCKDALNINEFVDSIKIQMSDLENFAHMDYPDGVSKIFVKNLNNVDTYLRPIHCSDLKREVLYIKDNNEWIKETDDKPLLKNAIKKIANKNIRQINEWVKEHPGCQDPTTKQNVKYNKIVMNSMSGGTVEEQHNNIEQIVKNVTKAVVIDKYAVK